MNREEELDKCKEELYAYWKRRCCYTYLTLTLKQYLDIQEDDNIFNTKHQRIKYDTERNMILSGEEDSYGEIHCYSGNLEITLLKPIAKKRNIKYNDDNLIVYLLQHISPILMKYNIRTFKFGTDMIDLSFLYLDEPLNLLVIKGYTNK